MKSLQRMLYVHAVALLGFACVGATPARASIITEAYSGIVTGYAGPPGGYSVGDAISGEVSYNSSLLTSSNGYTYTSPGSGNTFMFSYGPFTVTSGGSPGAWFTAGHFVPAPHNFLDISSGGGDEAFGAGEVFFSVTSFKVSSSPSVVPLPAGLPMFVFALLGMIAAGQFRKQRKTA
jgi:hypothetical protein